MKETKRLFIGIPLPQHLIMPFMSIKENDQLLNKNRGLRWVKPENLHLTLSFLGETSLSLIKPISEIMNFVCMQEVFELNYMGLGCFPNPSNPRVLWVGIKDPSHLRLLYNRLIRGLNQIIELDRPRFSPHITLARTSQYLNSDTVKAIKNLISQNQNRFFGSQKVEKIVLFESELDRTGPTYKIIHQSMLK